MKKMLTMCAVVAAALCAMADEWIDPSTGIKWTYVIRNGEVWIGNFSDAAIPVDTTGSVTIPSAIEGLPVTAVGSMAFRGCDSVTSITIPHSVTRFDSNAFRECGGITTVTIPSSVTHISSHPFGDCANLKEIVVEAGNAAYEVRNQLLCTKGGAEVIQCPCALKSVTIPTSVTDIRAYAFDGNSLTSISVAPGNKTFAVFNQLLCNASGTSVFAGPGGLSRLTFPSSVRRIEDFSFVACHGIRSIDLPSSLTYIGIYTFQSCDAMESLTIPSGVTDLCHGAFSCCTSLKTVSVSKGVPSIGPSFDYCTQLASISIPSSVTSIDRNAFYWCQALSVVHVEDGDTGRVRNMLEECWIVGGQTSVADQVTIVEDYEPEPGPVPPGPTPPEPEEGFEEAHTFNGLVYAGEVMCGIVQVTTGKRTAKDQVKVGGFVMLTDGKKQTIKSVTEDIEGGKLNVETKAGKLGDVELEITDNGFTGSVGPMTVKSGDVGEDTGIVSGTLKMSYFDAKTNKLKTRSIKLGGVASGGEAAGTLETKGEDDKTFEAAIYSADVAD